MSYHDLPDDDLPGMRERADFESGMEVVRPGPPPVDMSHLGDNNPCGPTEDEAVCACGCSGYDERCAYYLATYAFTNGQVRDEHTCCKIPGREAPVVTCQNILDDGETKCSEVATHIVHGLPGNPWQGAHCPRHTQQAVLNYDHQGGCVVRSIK